MQVWELIVADPDEGAQRLVSEYGARLYATAFRLCLNESDAEDLVQRTFVRVVERAATFKGESAFFTWMCSVLVNFYRMGKRGKARNSLVFGEGQYEESPAEAPDPAERASVDDEAHAIRAAVAKLPGPEREAVVLHYFGGLSVPEIAEAVHAPEGTVYYRLHEARKAIRNFLSKVFRIDGIKAGGRVVAK